MMPFRTDNLPSFLLTNKSHLLFLVLFLLVRHLSALPPPPSSAVQLNTTSFDRLPLLTSTLFTEGVLQELTARSPVECSQQCVEGGGCTMWTFFHTVPGSGGTGQCRLFAQVKQRSSDVWRLASGAESFGLSLTGGSPPPVSCPEGYEAKCGRCLLAVRDSSNYSVAAQRCQDSGAGQLATAQSLSDLQCVWEFMKTSRVFYAWVGADDRQVAGQFRWTNGDPLPDNSPLWRHQSGEPEKWSPGADCVRLHGAYLGLFDSPCKNTYDYVCQKS